MAKLALKKIHDTPTHTMSVQVQGVVRRDDGTKMMSTKDFRRSLNRGERNALRSGVDDMEDLREELSGETFDANDPVIRTLVEAIPGVGPVRLGVLLDGD